MKLQLLIVVLLVAFPGMVLAQQPGSGASADQSLEQGRAMIREGRLELIRSELHFTEAEASAFWPIYEQYRGEIDAIQDRYAAMVKEYLERYEAADLTNEYADELMATFFSTRRGRLDVQEKYLPRFRAVLPALKVARLFQIEHKISAEIDAQLALVVPLVDPS